MYFLSCQFNMSMFVYLFNFIAMFQPYYCNFFRLFLPASISNRLLCGQGLIMACVQSVLINVNLNKIVIIGISNNNNN